MPLGRPAASRQGLTGGPSKQAPAKRHSAPGRLTALTFRGAPLARPWTASPGEKAPVYRRASQEIPEKVTDQDGKI